MIVWMFSHIKNEENDTKMHVLASDKKAYKLASKNIKVPLSRNPCVFV